MIMVQNNTQHSTGPLKMHASGHDPEPIISGGKQQNPCYLSYISLYLDFLFAVFTVLPRRKKQQINTTHQKKSSF
jgi:hypothetical protein